ncbi:MAG: sensor histidine kinase KdpD [Gammaproteobacteria bacterium]
MPHGRPDPDQLLARVQADEARAARGKLRVFFGASAGVGKTYAMLEAARGLRATGVDVVVGYVEPHGRAETERLVEGFEQLPPLPVAYRGIVRHEFDLDAALRRRPEILLVDELAHSNLVEGEPAPRHSKRWQDIEELLAAGVSVWTTVNVQHLESLNDLIAQITGVRQRETVPDRIFDEADEVELIDLPPEDLLARLRAGKIYLPDEAGTAVERFFRKPNLLALRELALRRTADRVDAAARDSARLDQSSRPHFARDRLLVAIGPDDQAEQVIRAGKRLADALDAQWTVVSVETPHLLRLPEAARNRRIDLLRLAESLGAETVTLDGRSAADTVLEYAHTRNSTRIVVGAPKRHGLRAWLRPSTATELVRRTRGLDVLTISPEPVRADRPRPEVASDATPPQPVRWERYAWAAATTVLCTGVAALIYDYLELANLVMVYLLGVTLASVRLGRGPAVLTALANVLAFDFCFVPPRFSFAVSDAEYLVTFAVMLVVALIIANLMASVRQQTRVAGARERRTALLYAMSRELGATRGTANMARVAVRHVAEVFGCEAVVLLPDAQGRLHHPAGPPVAGSLRGADLSVAQWVLDHAERAGLGADTLPAAPALYLPLGDSRPSRGVLAVLPANRRRVLLPEQRHLLDTFGGQIGLALERAQLAEDAEATRVAMETEGLRNTLLASISHDLRTPLAVIAGAGSALAEHDATLDPSTRVSLARSVERKAHEMSELISNVLELTRLESGQLQLRRSWEALDELVGTALSRVSERLARHPVTLEIPDDLPSVHVDAMLVVQVFTNLLDNAAKYTPEGTAIRIAATADAGLVQVVVEDSGPGLPDGDLARLFAPFQRGHTEGTIAGAGLGLAICRAVIVGHGGQIHAARAPGGGARFQFTLPTSQPAP